MKKRTTVFALFIVLASALCAQAATYYWDAGAWPDVSWTNAANWNTDNAPDDDDIANVRTRGDGKAVPEISTVVTNISARIGGGANAAHPACEITIDSSGSYVLTDDLQLGYSLISDPAGAKGSLTVDGGNLSVADLFYVGNVAGGTNTNGAQGTLTINSGNVSGIGAMRVATAGAGAPAATNSTGSIVVNGGTLTNTTAITVEIGSYGNGTLTVNGGTVSFPNATSVKLGNKAGSKGTLELLAGSMNAVTVSLGAGDASIVLNEGLLVLDNNRLALLKGYVTNGIVTAIGGLEDDSALVAQYSTGADSFEYGDHTIKWGYDGSGKTALWAQSDEPPPPGVFETKLRIGYEGDGWVPGYYPDLTTTISIDGTGAVTSTHPHVTASFSGDPIPSNLYNQSFTYIINGRADLDPATGLGASPKGISMFDDSIVPGSGIRNDSTASENGVFTHELDLSSLPGGYDFTLTEVETRAHGAGETATFIDLVNPANRLSVTGGSGNQFIDVSSMGIAVTSTAPQTAFVSLCALTNNPASNYRLQTIEISITPHAADPEPEPEDPYTAWADGYSLVNTNKLADPDSDGLKNLMEFALGGNPTINDAAAIQPVASMEGDTLQYLYNRRTNHVALGLLYYLELTPDLIGTAFTNDASAYTVDGVSDPTGEFETVTNSIHTVDSAKFVTLTVEE
jgi:hypothetical protein